VQDALVHPYLEKFHDPEQETTAEKIFDWDFEQHAVTLEGLKVLALSNYGLLVE